MEERLNMRNVRSETFVLMWYLN